MITRAQYEKARRRAASLIAQAGILARPDEVDFAKIEEAYEEAYEDWVERLIALVDAEESSE